MITAVFNFVARLPDGREFHCAKEKQIGALPPVGMPCDMAQIVQTQIERIEYSVEPDEYLIWLSTLRLNSVELQVFADGGWKPLEITGVRQPALDQS